MEREMGIQAVDKSWIAASRSLENKLRTILTDPGLETRRYQHRGLIDRRRIAALVTGAQDVCKRRQYSETAGLPGVLVSVDGSSSMASIAQPTAYAINTWHRALGKAGVPSAFVVWQDGFGSLPQNFQVKNTGGLVMSGGEKRQRAIISEGVDLIQLQGWGDDWRINDGIMGQLTSQFFMTGTPTHMAMLASTDFVSRYPSKKKIVVFITDGAPNHNGPEYDAWIRQHITDQQRKGIYYMVLCIGSHLRTPDAWGPHVWQTDHDHMGQEVGQHMAAFLKGILRHRRF